MNAGCRSDRLVSDQSCFRSQLLDLYTEQLMDNLIRAHKGLPILHVDYTNITGSMTDSGTAGLALDFPGVTSTGGGSLECQLTVTGNPVIANAEVYNAYLNFIALPDALIQSAEAPPEGAAHIVQCDDDCYYWVPITYRREFFDLAMRTIARADVPKADQRVLVTATIQKIQVLAPNPRLPTSHALVLELDPVVPDGEGTFQIQLSNGTTYVLRVGTVAEPPEGYQLTADKTTNMLELNYVEQSAAVEQRGPTVPLTPQQLMAELEGKTIKIAYREAPSATPKPEALLQSILHQDQLMRLNTLGRGRP